MALRNHPNFSAQREGGIAMQNHWGSPWSMPASARSWRGSLRLTDITSAVVVTFSLLIRASSSLLSFSPRRGIIDVGGGGWGRVDCSTSSHIFDIGSLLLAHLLYVGVTEDDDLAVAGRPQDRAVELAKESLDEHQSLPGGPPYSNTDEQGWHEEISDRDPGAGGDLDDTGGGVLVSLGEGLPSVEGECELLVPLLSSIDG
jgi:hypothetical protein